MHKGVFMLDCSPSSEPATELLQRRWFATRDAVKTLEAECDLLLEMLKRSESSWRRASTQLAELRVIRDGLEEALDALDAEPADNARLIPPEPAPRGMSSRDVNRGGLPDSSETRVIRFPRRPALA